MSVFSQNRTRVLVLSVPFGALQITKSESNLFFFHLRLSGIKDLVRGKQLVSVILKLMGYCVKLKVVILPLFMLVAGFISYLLTETETDD